MRRRIEGVTLIEMIIVVAIAAVLLAIGIGQLNPNGAATRQAAQVVASAIDQARFEAVRTNGTAGFSVTGGSGGTSGSVATCVGVDETSLPLSCATGTISQTIDLQESDMARAVIASPAQLVVFFDRRGIVRNPSSSGLVISITDRNGANTRTVTVLPTGRTEVE